MTSVEKVYIKRKAVLWVATGKNRTNENTYSAGTSITLEWPQGFIQSQNPVETNETRSDEIIANQDLVIGSLVWLGALKDMPALASLTDLRQVISRTVTPDIKNRKTRYSFGLTYYGNTHPGVT